MAKIKTRAFKSRSNQGATLVVRDHFAPIVEDEKSPYHGEFPPLLAADGTPVTITLLGPESDVARRFDTERRVKAANRFTVIGQKKKESALLTPEGLEEQREHDTAKLVAMTVSWTGFVDDEGKPVDFTEDEARTLYTEDVDIREQAMAFISSLSAFFGRSSTPSAPSSSTTSA